MIMISSECSSGSLCALEKATAFLLPNPHSSSRTVSEASVRAGKAERGEGAYSGRLGQVTRKPSSRSGMSLSRLTTWNSPRTPPDSQSQTDLSGFSFLVFWQQTSFR